MIRFLNILALIAVIGSATWAYSVKYETILIAEKLRKREAELQRERDAVAVLQAEWQLLNRAARLQAIAKPEAGMQQVSARQIVKASEIPQVAPQAIDPLDSLLTGSLPTPDLARKSAKASGTTPAPPRPATARSTQTPAKTSPNPGSPKLATKNPARPGDPVRITPPARVGPPAANLQAAAPPPPASGGLTGFLKRLIQ